MAIDVSVGQAATLVVKLQDQDGNPTEVFDQAEGVQWTSSDDAVVTIDDSDATSLLDAVPQFLAPGSATLTVMLDGAPGGGAKRQLTFMSDQIDVHPEGAFSGSVEIVLQEQPAEQPVG